MTDANHRVIHREDNSFAVEVTRSAKLSQTVDGFATEAAAAAWIAEDKRLREADDPFRTPTQRKRRGF